MNRHDDTCQMTAETCSRCAFLIERERVRWQTTLLRAVVNGQAEDEGLWFEAQTAPEAYLQQELRRLHTAVEIAVSSIVSEP